MNEEELEAMIELEQKAIDEWFSQIGLDTSTTEAIAVLTSSHDWHDLYTALPRDWDQWHHFWGQFDVDVDIDLSEPFVGEEWMRYDPSEGF
jgi:hypothetical protein